MKDVGVGFNEMKSPFTSHVDTAIDVSQTPYLLV